MANVNQFTNEQVFVFDYDVSSAEHSGEIATHTVGQLPASFVITQAWIHVLTTFTSATDAATLALGYTGAANAFDAAIAISNGANPWDAAAPRVSDAAADGAVANFVTAAAGDAILATVAVEKITAGRVLLVVKGYRAA